MSKSHHIPKDFFDGEYLYAYAEDFLNTKIATQIRVLREQRGLTQEELAKKIGTQQPGIARLENVNYSAWKVETLKKLARAFDVVFICGFISLSTFLDEAEKFARKALEQPSFHDEITEQEKNLEEVAITMPDVVAKWNQIETQMFSSLLTRMTNSIDITMDMPGKILAETLLPIQTNGQPLMFRSMWDSAGPLEERYHGR